MRIPFRRIAILVQTLFGKYKRSAVILLILGVLGGLLESLGISILIPLFSHLSQTPIEGSDLVSRFFAGIFSFIGVDVQLRILLPLIVIVFVLRAGVLLMFDVIRTYLTSDFERTTRADMYKALLAAPWKYLSTQKIGFAENTIMVDVASSTRLMSDLTNMMLHVSSLIIYTAYAIIINPIVALATLIAGTVLLLLFRPFIVRTGRYGIETLSMNKVVAHHVNEVVPGMKTIKALGVESFALARATVLFNKLRSLRIRQTLMKATTTNAVQPAAVIFVTVLFAFSFLKGDFDLAVFAITIFLIDRIFIYFDRTQNLMHVIADNIPYAEHIVSLKRDLEALNAKGSANGRSFSFSKSLDFENVSFSYPDKRPVLSDVSLSLHKGVIYALVGRSGAGKTTLVDLILRLLSPTSGKILLDGIPVEDITLTGWHAKLGYVAQEPFLVNGTIEENIRFYDERISNEDISYAIKTAGLSDVIAKLPDGLATKVGERGSSLSGGEKQRIALARVLARRPELLVLDEPTSALDSESERTIIDSLALLKGTITVLIIAHKKGTVKLADSVFVIEKGHIVESGTQKELSDISASRFSSFFGTEE